MAASLGSSGTTGGGRTTAGRWGPWLAPVCVAGLYAAELLREEASRDPAQLAAQLVLGAPLVLAGSVLLVAVEQRARTGALTPATAAWVRRTPRALLLLFVAVLALFSLDVFGPGRSVGEIALALFMHNLPALGLLAATLAAWRWPLIGAVALATFAVGWMILLDGLRFPPSVVLLMGVQPLVVAALFAMSWRWTSAD